MPPTPPVKTARVTPTGFKMPDGYQSLVTLQNAPSIQLWEKQVKPPGVSGGDAIKTSTMHNKVVHTKAARKLIDWENQTFTFAYDPDAMPTIRAQVNVEQSITHTWPDHSSLVYYGWLMKVEFGELKEGEQPEGTATICVSNWDPVNYQEVEPVFTPAPGT